MIKITAIFTIVLVVGQCLALCGLFGSSLVDKYKEIERYLEEHVESSDVKENMDEIQRWYDMIKTKLTKNPRLEEALKDFVDLKESLAKPCNVRSVDILERAHFTYDTMIQRDSTRIGALIKHYYIEHYKLCAPHYVDRFNELNGIDPTIETTVSLISKDIAEDAFRNRFRSLQCGESIEEQIERQCTSFISTFKPNGSQNEINTIYNVLRKLAVGDGEQEAFYSKFIKNRRKVISSIYDKYLVEPCRYYVTRTENIFKPALFDTNTEIHKWGYFKLADVDPLEYRSQKETPEYHRTSLNYQVCDAFFVHPTKLVKEKVVRHAIHFGN